jgi:hypothetical protein
VKGEALPMKRRNMRIRLKKPRKREISNKSLGLKKPY